jgi:hypothetical protein
MSSPGNREGQWTPARLRELADALQSGEGADVYETDDQAAAALRDFAAVVALLGRVGGLVELMVWTDAEGAAAKLDYEPVSTSDTPLVAVLALAGRIEGGEGSDA